ncbi:phenylalanine--tRNA ligase subunit alpha [Candidatus Chloroploca sp. M-50]|uniref:Phenylalanine--tRNA ligase alpha subunit n=1 Tax=Candidatus Chloroploca mongolica TaxID=2528176 RepID=A0ABS4D5D9_9CHLR|nr:phenylalanine--tRNA ligase subunit alpha [Candidatus Chloroploca mongolica]MBP1464654.1 phenylalanine--tRNA ligase subunit alpha [Candidatus Chloroploca mongolica]
MTVSNELASLEQEAAAALESVGDLAALAEWKSKYTGKSGALTRVSRSLGALPVEQRPEFGRRVNQLREELEAAYAAAEQRLKLAAQAAELAAERIDVTMPGRTPALGYVHLTNRVLGQVQEIFGEMGFLVTESPEVEFDEYNFSLLNFADDHPARDMQDTFYLDLPDGAPSVLLRTHTSPGQLRVMRERAPEPLRILLPGKVYRNEQVTVRSEMMFHQFEFLAIGRHITMGDLKGTLAYFAERMYGPGTKVRLRPSFFPFTEPSAEMDVSCFLCGGTGCRVCKYAGWLEIGGCGMVHPNVLRNGGYDPEEFSGFAGGFGPERIAMLKYGIDDIRGFYSGDTRFVEQFG